jgi:hypothetical protein
MKQLSVEDYDTDDEEEGAGAGAGEEDGGGDKAGRDATKSSNFLLASVSWAKCSAFTTFAISCKSRVAI